MGGISINIPPVTGTGKTPADNDFFHQMLIMEVGARNFIVANSREDAQYELKGNVSRQEPLEDALPGLALYSLHLMLVRTEDNEVIVEQALMYSDTEETNEYLPLLVFTMLANIPPNEIETGFRIVEVETSDDRWRNMWLYANVSVLWTPRLYEGDYQSARLVNFGFGGAAEFHFQNWFSVETGVELAQDWVKVTILSDSEIHGQVLEIPLLAKGVIKPGRHFMLEPYMGIQLNLPLTGGLTPPLFSWVFGMQYGVKAGPGAVFLDGRFALDLGSSIPEEGRSFKRYAVKLALGYKLGFFHRTPKGVLLDAYSYSESTE
jgi:hypothetical protein